MIGCLRFAVLACAACLGFAADTAFGQQASIADPGRTTLTPGKQGTFPPAQDSRTAPARAHLESELSAFLQKMSSLALSPACARVLRNAVTDGAHFLIFTSDNDGTDSVMLYAAMACPPNIFDAFWQREYANFNDHLIVSYHPNRWEP